MEKTLKKMDKTLEAEDVTLLKHMLNMELKHMREENNIDILMFIGVDGRVFSSLIPPQLTPPQFFMLNLMKAKKPYICGQLKNENLNLAIEKYKEGVLIITGIGNNAFLASLFAQDVDPTDMDETVKRLLTGSAVLKHVFELRRMDSTTLTALPDDVANELRRLSRQLFVEQFRHTRKYKKNMEILEFIKKKVAETVGVGQVDEIITLSFNEMGTSAAYMTDRLWTMFMEKVIENHIRKLRGDTLADECINTWIPELDRKLRSFV